MLLKTINRKKIEKTDIDLIVGFLVKEKIVVLPTDTIYGLHCLATSEKAIKKIIRVKERPLSYGFVHLMKSYCQVHDYCKVSKKQAEYMRKFWPPTTRALQDKNNKYRKKPTTFILKNRGKLPIIASGGSKNTAIRLPKDELLITILKRVNVPLISSSFNISGKNSVPFARIKKEFKNLPDLVIDAGLNKKIKASKLIDISDINKIKILRK